VNLTPLLGFFPNKIPGLHAPLMGSPSLGDGNMNTCLWAPSLLD